MRQIKTFKRPLRKTPLSIILLVSEIMFIGSIVVVFYYVDLHEAKNIFAFMLLIFMTLLLPVGIGARLNYVILTETSFILRNPIFPFYRKEYPFKEIYKFTVYHSRKCKTIYLRIICLTEAPEATVPTTFIECVSPRDHEEIFQTLRIRGVNVQDCFMENDPNYPGRRFQ